MYLVLISYSGKNNRLELFRLVKNNYNKNAQLNPNKMSKSYQSQYDINMYYRYTFYIVIFKIFG